MNYECAVLCRVKILGTSIDSIDIAEDRDLFRKMMDQLGIPMPESGMATNIDEALACVKQIGGYPVMIRPSFVLGGRGMEVIYDEAMLREYVAKAVGVTPDRHSQDRSALQASLSQTHSACA